ncbi:MAG: hypothetical protein CFK52_13565 [Chloracidobacterium sp. CP2_5A]|nr:MAG: hypothetical protein CFK52_13565 [Chloracidobacterium sp. CP2_5A]
MRLGASGRGKTSLLKLVNRRLEPTAGAVAVEGRLTLEWDPIHLRRRIGYVIQESELFPRYTVARNVGLLAGACRLVACRLRTSLPGGIIGWPSASGSALRGRVA